MSVHIYKGNKNTGKKLAKDITR